MRGTFRKLDYTIPSNSYQQQQQLAGTVIQAASTVAQGKRRGMGQIYRRMGQATITSDPIGWVQENPLTVALVLGGAYFVFGRKGRR